MSITLNKNLKVGKTWIDWDGLEWSFSVFKFEGFHWESSDWGAKASEEKRSEDELEVGFFKAFEFERTEFGIKKIINITKLNKFNLKHRNYKQIIVKERKAVEMRVRMQRGNLRIVCFRGKGSPELWNPPETSDKVYHKLRRGLLWELVRGQKHRILDVLFKRLPKLKHIVFVLQSYWIHPNRS